jgi:hypothetical protein
MNGFSGINSSFSRSDTLLRLDWIPVGITSFEQSCTCLFPVHGFGKAGGFGGAGGGFGPGSIDADLGAGAPGTLGAPTAGAPGTLPPAAIISFSVAPQPEQTLATGEFLVPQSGHVMPSCNSTPHSLQIKFFDGLGTPQWGHIIGNIAVLGLKHMRTPPFSFLYQKRRANEHLKVFASLLPTVYEGKFELLNKILLLPIEYDVKPGSPVTPCAE